MATTSPTRRTGTGLHRLPLDDDADGTLTNQDPFPNVLPGSSTVTETLPVTGYDLTNIVCTG